MVDETGNDIQSVTRPDDRPDPPRCGPLGPDDAAWDAHCERHYKRERGIEAERDRYKAALEEAVSNLTGLLEAGAHGITLEKAVCRIHAELATSLESKETCPSCGGSGAEPSTDGGDRCLACRGTGKSV